jgi:cytochrome c oxidase cbb3-type subunit 3
VRTILILLLSGSLLAAVLLRDSLLQSRLLRSDPNAIPMNTTLMAFATLRGKPLYTAHCASCHGPRALGDSQRGIPNLTDDDWLYGTGQVTDIEQVIRYGIRSYNPKSWNLAIMPAFATPRPSARESKMPPLSPTDVRDVVEFLVSRQGRSADAAAVARGSAIFSGVGGCYDCHGVDATGDSAIGAPNLTDEITLYGDGSRQSLSMSISYGRAGICPAWVSRLSAAEIRDLALLVYSLSHPEGLKHGDPELIH